MAHFRIFLLLPFLLLACQGRKAASPLTGCRQLVLILTTDWDSHQGFARSYSRPHDTAPWRPRGKPVPVEIGRNGLAWGLGLHPMPGEGARYKREGDGRAPAGVFALTAAFGTMPEDQAGFIRLPYNCRGKGLECVDDPRSSFYNHLIPECEHLLKDWRSSEEMNQPAYDQVYRWGAVVGHNQPPDVKRGAGSCIFLHIADGKGEGTAGCTTMSAEAMVALLTWFDPAQKPRLVQLPQGSYEQLKNTWNLPGN